MDELSINQISYEWVNQTNNPKLLKKALKLLKDDGGYFPELERNIDAKLMTIDKKYQGIKANTNISPEDIKQCNESILNWENEIKTSDKILSEAKANPNEKKSQITSMEKKQLANNEKIKGNELMKTKEYDQAIQYYSNSIKYDTLEPTTYCNRALAFIKIKRKINYLFYFKEFQKGLEDCNQAIELNKDYIKAYYRRAACLMGLKKYREALNDLLVVYCDDTTNKEIITELSNLKSQWNKILGDAEWSKISSSVDKEIEDAKQGILPKGDLGENKTTSEIETKVEEVVKNKNKNTIATENTASKSGFKKIKIEEEVLPETPTTNAKQDDISEELKKKFEIFMASGEKVKKELQSLMNRKDFKLAEDIACNCTKDCEAFLKYFPENSSYYQKITIALAELNSLLNVIRQKLQQTNETSTSTSTSSSVPNANETPTTSNEPNAKYFRTNILAKETRENATKIAEQSLSFDDFPKSSYGFEKAFNSLKSKLDVFFEYLKYIGGKNISTIYQASEIPYPVLSGIINSIKLNQSDLKENAEMVVSYLTEIPKTKSFALVRKFLKKSDKETIAGLIEELKSYGYENVCEGLEKEYFK